MKKLIYLLIIILTTTGCAKITKLPKLLVLKRMADSQASIGKEIESKDKKFDLLVAAFKDRSINQCETKKEFILKYGEPILIKNEVLDGHELEKCLYRYQANYFNSDKVYVFFNKEGKVEKVDYLPVKK